VHELFIVGYWTLEFCHTLFKMWSREFFVSFFKCLRSLFFHRSKRPIPVTMTTSRIDSPMTVIPHQKVCHTLLMHYSQSCILHTSANSILYVHAFRYFKSSTGHTFHILSLRLISWRFMCNLGFGERFSWSSRLKVFCFFYSIKLKIPFNSYIF